MGLKPEEFEALAYDDLTELLRGDDDRRRWVRTLAAWAIVTLANLESEIQCSVASGKAPRPFTIGDVLPPDEQDHGEHR